jgi:hypothetical protein
MNTGNLQVEGLLLAVASLNRLLVEKGLVAADEIELALYRAEASVDEREELSPANRDAICFPIRFLRTASRRQAEGGKLHFSDLTREVGATKTR